MRRLRNLALRSIGIVILIILLVQVDLEKIWLNFSKISPVLFILALGVNFFVISTRALRWRYILRSYNRQDRFPRVLATCMAGVFLGLTTPGQAGEFAKVALLKGGGPRLLPTIVADRLLDVVPFMIIGILGGVLYLDFPLWVLVLVVTLIITLLLLFLWFRRRRPAILVEDTPSGFIKRFVLNAWRACLPLFSLRLLPLALFTLLILSCFFSYITILARSLHIQTPVYHLIFFVSLFSLARVLPISVMGVGTRDALAVFLFGTVGVVREQALAFSLSIFFVDLFYLLVGFFIYQYLVGNRGKLNDKCYDP